MPKRVWATHTLSMLSIVQHSCSECGGMGELLQLQLTAFARTVHNSWGEWWGVKWGESESNGSNENMEKPPLGEQIA